MKVGKGIYTQKKRNVYKINPNTGVYGNVTIDVPKLYGQLKLIAHKDGKLMQPLLFQAPLQLLFTHK